MTTSGQGDNGMVLVLDVISSEDIFVALMVAVIVLLFAAFVIWRLDAFLERKYQEDMAEARRQKMEIREVHGA